MSAEVALILVAYLFPFFLALLRRHHNAVAIGVTCVLLGWTILGWIVALIWATTARRGPCRSPDLRPY